MLGGRQLLMLMQGPLILGLGLLLAFLTSLLSGEAEEMVLVPVHNRYSDGARRFRVCPRRQSPHLEHKELLAGVAVSKGYPCIRVVKVIFLFCSV